jgi:RimJ/RimL family protein N-acetyltransferase
VPPSTKKFDIQRITKFDFEAAAKLYNQFYPMSIFSEWMLECLFFGVFDNGDSVKREMIAGGGCIVHSKYAANIGNFLTHPSRRREGYCRQIIIHLMNSLHSELGIRKFTLGTEQENQTACCLYESLGFKLISSRTQLDLTV